MPIWKKNVADWCSFERTLNFYWYKKDDTFSLFPYLKILFTFSALNKNVFMAKLIFWNFLSQLKLEIPLNSTNDLLPVLNLAPKWVLVGFSGPTISTEAKSEGSCPPLSRFRPSDSSLYPVFSGHSWRSFKKGRNPFPVLQEWKWKIFLK